MHIHVNGRNIEITEAIKAYVKEKIGKVATRYDQIQGIDVVLQKLLAKCQLVLSDAKKLLNQCMRVLIC